MFAKRKEEKLEFNKFGSLSLRTGPSSLSSFSSSSLPSSPPPPSLFGGGNTTSSSFNISFESKYTNITSSGSIPVFSVNGGGGFQKNETTSIHDNENKTSHHETVKESTQTSHHEKVKEAISLKVAVEKKKNRVVFAETNNDFLDVIFSFLTLPIGTILSLLQGKSHDIVIGCMNNIYESVRHLDARLFRTEACKEMLLHPRKLSESQCRKLKLKYGENLETPKRFYFCQNLECRRQGRAKLSEIPNAHCLRGMLMDQLATLSEQAGNVTRDEEGGVFVKGGSELFLITDNMQVMPGLTSLSIQLLKKLGITDANELEMQSVVVGSEKVMQLLGQAFVSGTPLTRCILSGQNSPVLTKDEQESSAETYDKHCKTNDSPVLSKAEQVSSTETFEEHSETNESKKMKLVLFISKSQKRVLHAECEEDFVDFLFSFLTFPLGSILKILDINSQLGSFDNLYRSVTDMSKNGHLKSEELKDMLLCPKLAPYFACDNQLLQIEESSHPLYKFCMTGDHSKIEWFVQPASPECQDFTLGEKIDLFSVTNPKSLAGESKQGGGFVKGPAKFMVTDDLTVKLLSPIESISFIGKFNVPIADVHEISVEVGVDEAKNLLRAALISKTALTDVFKKNLESNFDESISFFF